MKIACLLIIGLLTIWGCDSSKPSVSNVYSDITDKQPKNLNEAMAYINSHWSNSEKQVFKALSESNASSSAAFTTGLWIRNLWIRGNRNPALVKYFNSLGVYNPDDISSIIIVSYHRKLNHKPIALDLQVSSNKAYWKAIHDCETEATKKAVAVYNKFATGDDITIRMYVDTTNMNAVIFVCPNVDWKFDLKKDLEIYGTVIDRYVINSPSNVFFKVRVKKMNLRNIQILSEDVTTGQAINFSLKNLSVN